MEAVEVPQSTPPVEQKSTDWTKTILAALVGFGLLAGSAFVGCYYGTQQAQLVEEPSAPTPEPDYVPGDVLVTFEDNTTYKQAKDLFASMGIDEYSYAGPGGGYTYRLVPDGEVKIPEKEKVLVDDTLLQQIDLFKLKVPSGTEDNVIEKLIQESIVRYANKNALYQLP